MNDQLEQLQETASVVIGLRHWEALKAALEASAEKAQLLEDALQRAEAAEKAAENKLNTAEDWRCIGPDAPESSCREELAQLEEMCVGCQARTLNDRLEAAEKERDEARARTHQAAHALASQELAALRQRAEKAEAEAADWKRAREEETAAGQRMLAKAEAELKETERDRQAAWKAYSGACEGSPPYHDTPAIRRALDAAIEKAASLGESMYWASHNFHGIVAAIRALKSKPAEPRSLTPADGEQLASTEPVQLATDEAKP
jgi:hypothetical protein